MPMLPFTGVTWHVLQCAAESETSTATEYPLAALFYRAISQSGKQSCFSF